VADIEAAISLSTLFGSSFGVLAFCVDTVESSFRGKMACGSASAWWTTPPPVLASRLKALIAAGVMTKVAGERYLEYELTDKGAALWPVVLSLMSWGDDFCAPGGPRRLFRHAADGGLIDRSGRCDACGTPVPAADTIVAPGPGLERPADGDSRVTTALTTPHRLLEPLRAYADVSERN
jgi:hypothetical protein